jgi:oligopeptidase B
MKRQLRFTLIFIIIIAFMLTTTCKLNEEINIPVAEKIEKKLVIHGDTRIDYYYWMKDRENPKVIKYLEDENNYISEKLKHTESLQDTLFKEINDRIKPDDKSVPYKDNDYFYYEKYSEQEEHPVYCRKKGSLDADEEILLDVNVQAEGFPFYYLNDIIITENNELMAYSADTSGRRKYEIRFRNIDTGKDLPEIIVNTDGEPEWASDNKTLFYVKKDENTLREFQIWKHTVGSKPETDKLIYEEKDETFYVSLFKSKSDNEICIGSYNTISTEYRYIDADKPLSDFKIIFPRKKNIEYYIETHENDLFVLTNENGANNFKILKTNLKNPDLKNAEVIVPHNANVFIEDFEVFNDYLVVNERKDGLIYLRIIDLKDKTEHYLDCGEEVYEIWISDNYEYDTDILRFGYSSLTTPTSWFDYNMKTKERILLKQQFAGNNFDKTNYESKRLFAEAIDGVKIPVSLVFRKGITLDGNNPLLIYGYGSYGLSAEVSFNESVLSLLDRGFIFAIAHVRGGQELGRTWYEDGKLLHKKNTFTDFTACTNYLQKNAWSNPGKTFAMGGSAGGLLVGAVANMHPELYCGIVAEVPFVDVVTTMLDESIPLTTGEYDEWGDPNEKKYYNYMLSYSPYDQVKKQNYPAMLITAGLHDSQVQYWEPAKWTAKLREYNTGDYPIYLFTIMDAGHSGVSGRYKANKEIAIIYAFMLDLIKNK